MLYPTIVFQQQGTRSYIEKDSTALQMITIMAVNLLVSGFKITPNHRYDV